MSFQQDISDDTSETDIHIDLTEQDFITAQPSNKNRLDWLYQLATNPRCKYVCVIVLFVIVIILFILLLL